MSRSSDLWDMVEQPMSPVSCALLASLLAVISWPSVAQPLLHLAHVTCYNVSQGLNGGRMTRSYLYSPPITFPCLSKGSLDSKSRPHLSSQSTWRLQNIDEVLIIKSTNLLALSRRSVTGQILPLHSITFVALQHWLSFVMPSIIFISVYKP